jgi:hypothetical protein
MTTVETRIKKNKRKKPNMESVSFCCHACEVFFHMSRKLAQQSKKQLMDKVSIISPCAVQSIGDAILALLLPPYSQRQERNEVTMTVASP